MKKTTLHLTLFCTLIVAISSCNKPATEESYPRGYLYDIKVSPVSVDNAPALQSFAHGIHNGKWLLFAGRTNQDLDDGGLHDLNGNYTSTSFVPMSYNQDIMVYDVTNDEIQGMTLENMLSAVKNNQPKTSSLYNTLSNYQTIFRNSNPLATQEGEYIYVIGGYGPPIDKVEDGAAYITFDQVAKIHVPSMIALVTGDNANVDWEDVMAFGTNSKLVSTGGEMFKLGDKFYVAGGHNFTNNSQKYLDAVYPFTITRNPGESTLTINANSPISDMTVEELSKSYSDQHSKFRRRDGPTTPALFKNAQGELTQGITFYGGVFKPDSVVGTGSNQVTWHNAWNHAIYVHPEIATSTGKYFTFDNGSNQQNNNVYACADLEFYDSQGEQVHTFLFGGIGNGEVQSPFALSYFTNKLMHINYDLSTQKSSPVVVNDNIFGSDYFYGAEARFMPNASVVRTKVGSSTSDVIDIVATMGDNNTLELGHIYGGIEAFVKDPGTFGPKRSAASNKVWKVTVTRTPKRY